MYSDLSSGRMHVRRRLSFQIPCRLAQLQSLATHFRTASRGLLFFSASMRTVMTYIPPMNTAGYQCSTGCKLSADSKRSREWL